jgi:hypothetical protein
MKPIADGVQLLEAFPPHAICEALDIPLWCGEQEAPAAEDGRIRQLRPVLVSFGHGRPLRDPVELEALMAGLA